MKILKKEVEAEISPLKKVMLADKKEVYKEKFYIRLNEQEYLQQNKLGEKNGM